MNIIKKKVFQSTWADLKAAAEAGTLGGIVQSGDLIPVTLKSGEEIVLKVAHDENGNLFFVLVDCMEDEHTMNNERTNKGGWDACGMRKYLNKTVLALLPDDLQAVIAPTTIVQIVDGERVESVDKLFLLSKTQVFGKGDWSDVEPEDTQIDCFRCEKDRVKESAAQGDHCVWWLRSPVASSSSNFYLVNSNGYSGSTNLGASSSYGVAFGFRIS